MAETMDVRAEVLPEVVQDRVRTSLKRALQDQLSREAKTLGGTGADVAKIHAKSGISWDRAQEELINR
jgi:hypothetical protein